MITIQNPFHGTSVVLRPKANRISPRTYAKAREALCPVPGCTCFESPASGLDIGMITGAIWEEETHSWRLGRAFEERPDRLFIGVFPCGLSYADRYREQHGDYKRLAFLSYATLELRIETDCPPELATRIREDAGKVQARRGEQFQVSSSGQTVLLGDDSHLSRGWGY